MREALVIPLLFQAVVLLGSLRLGADVRLVPPSPAALILAVLLTAALVRSRALLPGAYVSAARPQLANVNGIVVVITSIAAAAQVFNLLTPDTGLLYVVFTLFFGVQLLTSIAGIEERRPMLRALMVLFGSAFVLRYIVLEGLFGAEPTVMKRVVTALVEGVTLGTLAYEPQSAAAPYVALLALTLYFVAVWLLGGPGETRALVRVEHTLSRRGGRP